MLEVDADLMRERPGLLLISDKGSASKGITLLLPSEKKEILRPDESMLSIRHLIESASDTLKGRFDREQHDGHAVESVAVRVTQRMLAPAAVRMPPRL